MARLNYEFDANSVEPQAPREVLPAGDYLAQIVKSEMMPTKSGDGSTLTLELEVVSGPYERRRIWDRLNLDNPNAQAVEIAQRTLSAICHATGVLRVSDSEALHFKPMLVKVSVKPAGPDNRGVEREAQNEVKGYRPATGAATAPRQQAQDSRPAQRAPQQQARTASAPAASGPPWRRGAAA